MKQKKFNLRKEYRKSWNYLLNAKNFIYFIVGVFFIFVLIGFFIPAPDFVSSQIFNFIKQILEKTKDMNGGELIKFIFLNNLQSSFTSMIFGIGFGIFSVFAAISNGYLLGFVASLSVESRGILVLWRILPHGVFEIPAIFISLGLGLMIGFNLMKDCILFYNRRLFKLNFNFLIFLSILFFPLSFLVIVFFTLKEKKLRKNVNYNILNSLKVFLFIVLPLLIVAGIIEGLLISLLS